MLKFKVFLVITSIISLTHCGLEGDCDEKDACKLGNIEGLALYDCPFIAKKAAEFRKTGKNVHELDAFACGKGPYGPLYCCPDSSDTRFSEFCVMDDKGENPSKASSACKNFPERHEKPLSLHNNVLGGNDSSPGEFPHFAALGYLSEGVNPKINYDCGGVLISGKILCKILYKKNLIEA
jgi:predicted small lipoprotein YifL